MCTNPINNISNLSVLLIKADFTSSIINISCNLNDLFLNFKKQIFSLFLTNFLSNNFISLVS